MGPSLRDHSSFVRPATRERPGTRDQGDTSLVIPSRTSSLHSRITQPIPSTLSIKPTQRTPKTLTHAYMVCGVGREPSQWVRAPPPAQGKIGHMKGAVGQFWLPEILGSSPRLEQDNEIARALHAAMRVSQPPRTLLPRLEKKDGIALFVIECLPFIGMLSPRRRDLHWSNAASLCTPLFRPSAGLFAYSVRHCTPGVVSRRRKACRDHS